MFPLAGPRLRPLLLLAFLAFSLCPLAGCREEPAVPKDKQLAAVLKTMRDGLSAYAKKNGRFPRSLDEMVASGVISEIPIDPVSNSRTTWTVVREESVAVTDFSTATVAEQEATPIVDIRSGASGSDPRGVPWSEY